MENNNFNKLISNILHEIRLENTYYCRSELYGQWGISIKQRNHPGFHFITEGNPILILKDKTINLSTGDILFYIDGYSHSIVSDINAKALPFESFPLSPLGLRSVKLTMPKNGKRTLIICGGMNFESEVFPIYELLPSYFILKGDNPDKRVWLNLIIETMRKEVKEPGLGSEIFLSRMIELLFIEALRIWIKNKKSSTGLFKAFMDPRLGKLLSVIHSKYNKVWNTESLTKEAGMSKTMLYKHFKNLIGLSPLQYLSRLRMHSASILLKNKGYSVFETADYLGYGSEAAFSRAFKKITGKSPGTVRKEAKVKIDPMNQMISF